VTAARSFLSTANHGEDSDRIPLLDDVVLRLLLVIDNYQRNRLRNNSDACQDFAHRATSLDVKIIPSADEIFQSTDQTQFGSHISN
jgi:hypothetical protein